MSPLKPGRRWPIYPVRALCVLLVALVLTQAALAGGFISGNVRLLGLHSANAILVFLVTTALVPCTILLLAAGRGPWWPVPVSIGLWMLVVTQLGLGYARVVSGHIPLGVAILGLLGGLTVWSFGYRPKWMNP